MTTNSQRMMNTAGSGGFVGALVVILCYILSYWGIAIPAEVSAAMMMLLTPLVHYASLRLGINDLDDEAQGKGQ